VLAGLMLAGLYVGRAVCWPGCMLAGLMLAGLCWPGRLETYPANNFWLEAKTGSETLGLFT
jgi:hypothetical protein